MRLPERDAFPLIEKELRKKTFGILTVLGRDGRPHSTGILYGVAPPEKDFALYMVTSRKYAKARYVQLHPDVSFVVTFPHRFLSSMPAGYVMLRGTAELRGLDDEDGQWAFQQRWILRKNMEMDALVEEAVFIRIDPDPIVFCFGVGVSLLKVMRDPSAGGYKVRVPDDRLRHARREELYG